MVNLEHTYLEEETKSAFTEKSIVDLNKDPKISLKKIRDRNDYRGSGTRWPLCIVKLILEQLVNSTPPTFICHNIVSRLALTIPFVELKKLPGIRIVRNCRTDLRIISETLTPYQLSKSDKWE